MFGTTNRSPCDLPLAGLVTIDLGDEASIHDGCAALASRRGDVQCGAERERQALNMWSVKAARALKPEGIGVVMLHLGWVQTDTGRFVRWDGHDHPW